MTTIYDVPVCPTCHQDLPYGSPYRENIPTEETSDNPFATIQSKLSFGWSWVKYNCPKPLAWMFKSLGWVAVGGVVVSVAAVAGYFLARYLIWALIVMLGKWLLDRIGRGIPRVVDGMSVSMPHTDFGFWEIGLLAIVGVVVLAAAGKFVVGYVKSRSGK